MIKRAVEVWMDADDLVPTIFRPGGTELKIIITLFGNVDNQWVRDRFQKRVCNIKDFESEMSAVIRKNLSTGDIKYKSLIGEDFG